MGGERARRGPAGVTVLVAAGLSAVEGLAFVALGVGELAVAGTGSSGAVVSAAFFVVCAAGLGWCALGLRRGESWSRGALVATQLLLLAIAWSYHRPYPEGAGVLAAAAATCLGLLLAPATTRALGDRGS